MLTPYFFMQNAFRKKRNLGFFFSSRNKPELDYAQMRRRFPKTYARQGKRFLSSFPTFFYKGKTRTFMVDLKKGNWEAPIQVSLVTNHLVPAGLTKREWIDKEAFMVKLDFAEGIVKIVGMQGGEWVSAELREFAELTGQPTTNFLIRLIEAHAKKQGYTKIQITRPENNPHINTVFRSQEDVLVERTSRGRELLLKVKNSRERKGKKREEFITENEKLELKALRKKAEKEIVRRRKKMYTQTALSLGYTPGKNWFEKIL
jgi:hypothetical protein